MSRHKKSDETSKNDGRKYNRRLAPKPLSEKKSQILPKRQSKAKKARVQSYAVSAMKGEFGSEKEFFKFLAAQSRKSLGYMKLFMEYAYGKPSDKIDSGGGAATKLAPQITFNMPTGTVPEKTIDISEDE